MSTHRVLHPPFSHPAMPSLVRRNRLRYHRRQQVRLRSCQSHSPQVRGWLYPTESIAGVNMTIGASTATPPFRHESRTPDWSMADVQEFVPRHLEPSFVSFLLSVHPFEAFYLVGPILRVFVCSQCLSQVKPMSPRINRLNPFNPLTSPIHTWNPH